ncbi:MAG TPA: SAM-dependent methyltransferase [Streptosporangiaceae bacterium]|nr:SAM-dependent methyltransferase [Streptosporangiaceae bacterium]
MPACPGASSEPLSTGPALRLAPSDGEAVPSSRADPDRPLGAIPPPVTVLDQLSFESGVPNVARVYDALLGGKDNLAADREAARRLVAAVPGAARAARASRAFLGRAVRYLAGQGITQYLDIGSGLPTQGSVHQVAHDVNPDTRVVYADHDPVVVAHARALLADSPAAGPPKVTAVEADLRYPRHLLTSPEIRAPRACTCRTLSPAPAPWPSTSTPRRKTTGCGSGGPGPSPSPRTRPPPPRLSAGPCAPPPARSSSLPLAPGRYQILAAINAVHTSARDIRDTDWSQIVALYDQLARLDPSPVIALNRAIAVAELDGPEVALAAVDRLEDKLAGYHAYHATRADLLHRLGRSQKSRAAYDKAIELAGNTAETAYLTRRRDQLG